MNLLTIAALFSYVQTQKTIDATDKIQKHNEMVEQRIEEGKKYLEDHFTKGNDYVEKHMEDGKEYGIWDFCELLGLKESRTKDILKGLSDYIEVIGGNRDRRYKKK